MDATLEPRLVIQSRPGIPYVEGDFLVAAYQRGYRWGREEVRALLDDITTNERDAEARAATLRTTSCSPSSSSAAETTQRPNPGSSSTGSSD
jgi:hypothetical protein